MPATNNANVSTSSMVLNKVGLLLEKTKDALIADLKQEFIGVITAFEKFEKEQEIENLVPVIDAVFAKVGYDISHYEELSEVRSVVEKLLGVTEKIAKAIEDGSKVNEDGEISAEEIASLTTTIVPLIQELVELVKLVSDIEWKSVADDLEQSGKDIKSKVLDEMFTKDFARKILDHILMTLLKNAKVVFKDEIDFAKFTIESGINELVADATKMRDELKKNVFDKIETDAKVLENVMKETLNDATALYNNVREQVESQVTKDLQTIAKEYNDTYVKIANGLSITYSILEFLGIVEQKQITLQLPDGLKEAIGKVQSAVDKVSDGIGEAAEKASAFVANTTSTVVETMDDAMKTTRDITGMGVAAAGTIDLQIQSLDKFVNVTTEDITSGIGEIADVLGKVTNATSAFKSGLEGAQKQIDNALDVAKNFRYPMTINVLSWEKVEDLFTSPVEHFKALYPINSMADVESLMTKIMGILHSINSDIPDFSSLKKLLENLLRRLQRMVMKKINELKAKAAEVADSIKKKINETIDNIWNWFKPVVTTIRNVIRMLKELAVELKDKMKDVLENVKDGAMLIATDLQKDFDTIKGKLEDVATSIKDGIEDKAGELEKYANTIKADIDKKVADINKGISQFKEQIENNANKAINEAVDVANDIVNGAETALDEKASELKTMWLEIQKDMPKMPNLNLPKVIRTTLAEPMANCVKETIKESLQIDLSSVLNFSEQRNELVACVSTLKTDWEKVKSLNLTELKVGITEKDFTDIFDGVNINFATAYQLPNIPQIVQQIVVPDLQVWAYGTVSSIQQIVSPKAWKERLDTLVAQLKAEFQNDLSNVTGLISKEGAMRLINDASSVRDQLKNELNITDYITIVETAVNDVVLPDPEYYYSSFKQCILNIITKLTSRILQEVSDMKNAFNSIKDELKSALTKIKEKVQALSGKLETAANSLVDQIASTHDKAKEAALQLFEDIKATVKAIKNIVTKIPETIESLGTFLTKTFTQTLSSLKSKAQEVLRKIVETFKDKLEDLAIEVWNKFKNEYLIPLLRAIKNRIIHFVKHVIKKKIQQIIDALTDLKDDAVAEAQSFLNNDFFKNLRRAQKTFVSAINEAASRSHQLGNILGKLDGGKITNLNQLPAVVTELQSLSAKDFKEVFGADMTINIQFDVEAPEINVPYYYVTWAQNVLTSTVAFVQSDMGLAQIFTLVQSLYKGIPSEVKSHVADLFPSLPSLPGNKFTELLDDVSCSYDLNNMMANVTLLDLKPEKKAEDDANSAMEWDASLKLQLFIMVGSYSKDGFVEKKKEEEQQATLENKSEETTDVVTSADSADEATTVPAIFFTLMLQGKMLLTFKIGEKHYIKLNGEGHIGAEKLEQGKEDLSVGFCLSKKDSEKGINSRFHAFGSTKSLGAILSGEFSRNEEAGPAKLLATKYLDINMGNYPLGLYILYNAEYPKFKFGADGEKSLSKFFGAEDGVVDGFTAGVYGAVKDFELVLKLRQNDFFTRFLKDDISAKFDLELGYDYLKGFKMDGGYTFHLDIDCNNKKIGPMTLSNLGIDLGSVKNDLGTMQLQVGTSFSVALGESVTMSVENLCVGASVNIVKKDADGKHGLGDFDFDFKFKFPEGIGVAIDCQVLKGAALIGYDEAKKELFGAMELTLMEKFGVSAMLIMTFGNNFSMVAMLSVRFSPGIPLGMGFSLTAVGGMLGLNRMLDYDAIRESVHNGSLESVFFVEDVLKHIGDMRKAAEKIFPAKKDQFFVGLLGQISYEPVVKCSFGLMFQAPDPLSIIIVGALKVGIEGTDVIRINVAFAGEIDFDKGIQFDASLYDSDIVGIRLEGDMAFRLFWGGETKGFLMSVGGFHPAYTPEAGMNVSDMRRLAMKLDYNVLKVGLETYLAITSNTFQIGAHLDIKVGWDKFGIIGYAGFDALFQFDPFMFMFDIEAGMAVMVGGSKVLSVDLALSLSGPRPWHAKGSAGFWFLFIPVNIDFDITWGAKKQELPEKQIEVLKLLEEQINNLNNWAIDESSRRDKDVILVQVDNAEGNTEEKTLVLSPNGVLSFNQSAIPMELEMDLCNNAVPTDVNELVLDKVVVNNKEYEIINKSDKYNETGDNAKLEASLGETISSDFAPALYKQMNNDQKLNSPSYMQYASGFIIKNGDERIIKEPNVCVFGEYETYVRNANSVAKPTTNGTKVAAKSTKNSKVIVSTAQTGKRVAYAKKDKNAVERYVDILDTIQ